MDIKTDSQREKYSDVDPGPAFQVNPDPDTDPGV
jgi:hypothetical protein